RTLGHAVDSIHFHAAKLPDPMPMDGGTVAFKIILDRNFHLITPTRLNPRAWIRSVEYLALGHFAAIRPKSHIRCLEVVLALYSHRMFNFVICINVEFLVRALEPAASIIVCRTWFKAFHCRVFASEHITLRAVGRFENRMVQMVRPHRDL